MEKVLPVNVLQTDSSLGVLLSLRTLRHCRALEFECHPIPSLKSVKPGHSGSLLDQANKYLTCPGLCFHVAQMPVIAKALPHAARSCLCKLASDRMICLSHLISFLLPLSGQCLIEAAVNREHWVLLACTTKLFSHLTQHGI